MPESPQPMIRARQFDAISRLTPFGWSGGLVFITALSAASFFLAGYFIIYWQNADMDFMVVYSALLLNDGQPAFFPHPAYFTILCVKLWFQLLQYLHLLDTSSLSRMPSASNVPAFDAAMTNVIRAARLVAWLTATGFVLVFAGLARFLVRDWRVAMLGTFAFAFSGGLQFHMRILRSELIAGCFFAFALMILIAVARQATIWRPLAIAFAATLCVLSLENKIHAVLLIATLPLLIQLFGGASSASVGFWDKSNWGAWLATVAAALLAGVLLYAAIPLISLGLSRTATTAMALRPLLFGTFGVYQTGLLVWIGVGMLAFAKIWRICLTEALTAMFAAIAGASLGVMALLIEFNASDVVVVIYTLVLFTSPRPTVFLTWLIFPGIVYAWRRGERQAAAQAALLMLCAIGIDSIGIRRGLKVEYFILTDPLIIIAGLVLLNRLTELRFLGWAYPAGVALVALHVGISQAEPIKLLASRRNPERICEWNQFYLPLLPMPWCDLPVKRP